MGSPSRDVLVPGRIFGRSVGGGRGEERTKGWRLEQRGADRKHRSDRRNGFGGQGQDAPRHQASISAGKARGLLPLLLPPSPALLGLPAPSFALGGVTPCAYPE